MNKKLYLLFIVILSCAFVYFSCANNTKTDYGKNSDDENDPSITITTEPFIKDSSGYVKYSTNDSSLLTGKGSSFWQPNIYTNASDNYVEVETSKSSGDVGYGFGVIFCIQDSVTSNKSLVNNFYAVLIKVYTAESYFQINKVVEYTNLDGTKDTRQHRANITGSDKDGWKKTANLYSGKGVKNKIKISYTGKNIDGYSQYDIYFNDTKELSYTDNFLEDKDSNGNTVYMPAFDGDLGNNKYGFIVTLSPNENFPFIPVEVTWKQNYPLN